MLIYIYIQGFSFHVFFSSTILNKEMYKLLPQSAPSIHDEYLLQRLDTPSPELTPAEFLQEAIFAAGSFWQLESAFGRVDGVLRTATGYFGGSIVKPRYKEVLEGWTGHTEAVKVTYDKRKTSYKSLCKAFWEIHDPTDKEYLQFGGRTHRQSAIFCSSEEDKKQAQQSKIEQQMKLNRRIVTKIIPRPSGKDSAFYLAESHHQKYYLQKNYIRLCESIGLRSAEQFADSYLACRLNGMICRDKKINVAEDLNKFVRTHQLPHETKLVLGTMIQDLRMEQALELTSTDEIGKDKKVTDV